VEKRANLTLAGLALFYFLLVWIPGFANDYRYFIDEFYYLACADHLAFGYVDHPPLSIWLLWLVRAAAGDSLIVLRLVPALAGGVTVFLTGLLARRLGAGLLGQLLAAAALMAGSVFHIIFGFYSMNALSPVLWLGVFLVLVEIERRNEPRLWLLVGALAGIGLENKHTFVLLLAALTAGVVITGARRHLRSGWLWSGVALAVLLISPNVIWQVANGWPSLEFYRNADLYKNLQTPPLEVLAMQVLVTNPGTLPIWLGGLGFFLVSRHGRAYRHLGWIPVVLLILMVVGQKSRPDRIAAVYPLLFAGGATYLAAAWERTRSRWLSWGVPVLLAGGTVLLAPVGLPLLSPSVMAAYTERLGLIPQIEEGKDTELPQWFADRTGWEQFVDDVAGVVGRLEPVDRQRAVIVVASYGHAGALELLGRGRDLPPVYAPQNSYYSWGPPPDSVDVVILTGPFDEDAVRSMFAVVDQVWVHDCRWCTPWRDEIPFWVAREPRLSMADLWPRLKHYE
jgi:4-amino-4-deoxy-L-arabinose transferase-like glycosyltransferase